MSDEKPWFAPHQPPAKPRERQPGELLFEFYRERDKTRWMCELRDHGEFGVEAQFFRNEELLYSRRFDPRLDASRPSRELAIQWATEVRAEIEGDDGTEHFLMDWSKEI